jgi:hypothetical protein
MAGNRTLKLSILADTDNLVKGLKQAESDTEKAGSSIGDTFKKVGKAAALAGAAAGAFAIKLGIDAVKAASDLSETISKTNVLFEEGAVEVQKFAETAAKQFGQSKQQALDAATQFATFGKAAGLAGKQLVNFSTDFVGLASDLASFNNTSPEEAINAIGSALRGESEPLRRFGVLLNDATLKTAALELGLISNTKNALTPQQKVLAAQKVIYEQTTAAQGDFARTSDGLANSQRILSAELENVKVEIGEKLLPVALKLFTFFKDNVVPIFTAFTESSDGIVKNLREQLIPVFNILRSAYDKISTAIRENADEYRPLIDLLKSLASFVKGTVAPILVDVLGVAFTGIVNTVAFLIDKIGDLIQLFARLGTAIKNSPLGSLGSKIGDIFTGGGSKAGLSVSTLEGGAGRSQGQILPGVGGKVILNGREYLEADGFLVPQFSKNLTAAESAIYNRFLKDEERGAITVGAQIKEQQIFDILGFKRISDLQGNAQPNVTINVQAPSVIDEEGFARAVGTALSNATARAGTVQTTPTFAV